MKRTPLSVPEIALIGGTRAALGAGLALILGDRLSRDQRQAIGWTLFGVGAVTTLPILIQVLKSQQEEHSEPRVSAKEPAEYVNAY